MAPPNLTSLSHDFFPEDVSGLLSDLASTLVRGGYPLASVAVFGSAVRPDFAPAVSDVDLIIVFSDDVSREDRHRVREEVSRLERVHGLRPSLSRTKGFLGPLVDGLRGHARASVVCSRSDLLAGDMAKVLGLSRLAAWFADRTVLAAIFSSAVTAWGEDLVPDVPIPAIRRRDVFKAFSASVIQGRLFIVAYRVIPDATRHAMDMLKRSLHNCYFCYRLRAGTLEEEVAFFEARWGEMPILRDLLELRREYRDSFWFVLRCLPTVARLHWRTARENRFPREPAPR